MKALMYMMPGLKLCDLPEPCIAKPQDVKVKIHYASICGSDTHIVNGDWDGKFSGPFVFGHEASGEIVELGDQASVKGLRVGDRVCVYHKTYCNKCFFCRNGQEHLCLNAVTNSRMFAEYIVVDEQAVYKLPGGVDTLRGCMAEPVSVCLHAVDILGVKPGESAAVFGAGGLGLLVTELLRLSGAGDITAIEPIEEKRALAMRLGASGALDPTDPGFPSKVMAATGGRGFQKIMEMSGNGAAAAQALATVSRGGTIVYFSNYSKGFELPVDAFRLVNDEISIRGVFQSPYMFPRVMALLPRLDLGFLTANVMPFDDALKAWDAHMSRRYPKLVLKVAADA